MDKFTNVLKATVIVVGSLALLGLVVILFPVLAGIAGFILGLFEVLLPIILVAALIYIVYYIIKTK